MANKDKLKQMLTTRNPLDTKRETVTPVNLYEKPEAIKKTHKPESTQVHKPTSVQTDKDTKPQTVKETSPQVVKYTTHLTPETVKAVKQRALDTDKKDYQVIQEALDQFLQGGKNE